MITKNTIPGRLNCGICNESGEHVWSDNDWGPVCEDCKDHIEASEKQMHKPPNFFAFLNPFKRK